ncbi:MAG: polysaccharide biosynthesis protein [Rhizobiaceae bacterium]
MIGRFFFDTIDGVKKRGWLRNGSIILIDTAIGAASVTGAYIAVFGFPAALQTPNVTQMVVGFTLLCCISFIVFGTHRGAWRYVSIHDVVTFIKASGAAVAIAMVAVFLVTRGDNVPRSVPVFTFIFMMAGLVGVRLAYRIAAERVVSVPRHARYAGNVRRVLLLGLTDKAEAFIRLVRRDPASSFEILGLLDDSPVNMGRSVQGVRVLGRLEELPAVLRRCVAPDGGTIELVVTESAPSRRRLSDIVERANECGLKVSRIPDMSNVATVTTGSLVQPKPVEIGDLLERPEVTTDTREVGELLAGKVVLVAGAGGSIGSELCRQIAAFAPSRLIITDASEFLLYTLDTELRDAVGNLDIVTRLVDVRDRHRVDAIFSEMRPEIVFHAAALKHVPLMEANPLEALKTNIIGTRNVADAALANEANSFIMISTDKVVNPTNVMGASKRAAESYCQALDVISTKTRFKTVRFGNVLGSNGSVVPRFQKQIEAGGPVTVTHPNMMRFFMTIPEAVSLVLHACAHAESNQSERGKIMVLDMGKPVRIADLAERMIQLAGFRPRVDIDIVYSGLRPGEKLVEELFDPSEIPGDRTEEGYMLAAPRFADRKLLSETFRKIEEHAEAEQTDRAMHLLEHVVPEFRKWTRIREDAQMAVSEKPVPSGSVVTLDKRAGEGGRSAAEGRSPPDSPPSRA